MIYLSAQPDDYYFIWQLEIQLRNFKKNGISEEFIHVLIGYNPMTGVSSTFDEFITRHRDFACFFLYPDERMMPDYISTIRPHIIKKHFEAYPELYKETIFYHDSDVLFTRSIDMGVLTNDDVCYVSDTRNYLDIGYILEVSSNNLLFKMADIVGVEVDVIKQNDHNAGGAQYVLKNIPKGFWEKVEVDSERLFKAMKDFNSQRWQQDYPATKIRRTDYHGIQSWCADMWAMFWGLLYWGKTVKIHPIMNFSWPYSPIEKWNEFAIHHYSGSQNNRHLYFKKTDYVHFSPWYDDSLKEIKPVNCSYKLVEIVHNRKAELDKLRIDAQNVLFVVWDNKDTDTSVANFHLLKKYIMKNFNTNVKYYSDSLYAGDCHGEENWVDLNTVTKKIIILPVAYIYPKEYLMYLISFENKDEFLKIGTAFKLDMLFEIAFGKVLTTGILEVNRGKLKRAKTTESIGIFSILNSNICDLLRKYQNSCKGLEIKAVHDFSVYKLC